MCQTVKIDQNQDKCLTSFWMKSVLLRNDNELFYVELRGARVNRIENDSSVYKLISTVKPAWDVHLGYQQKVVVPDRFILRVIQW